MKTEFFAVFDKHGFIRATKNPVDMKPRQIGVMIDVELPDKAFDKGFIEAKIKVPENAFVLPTTEVVVRPRVQEPKE